MTAPFPAYPLAANKSNNTPSWDDHPEHHDDIANGMNSLQEQIIHDLVHLTGDESIDGNKTFVQPVNFGGQRATNAATPTAGSDLATMAYVLSVVSGTLNVRGNYDASSNLFPTTGGSGPAGAVKKGDFWICSVAGTLTTAQGAIATTPGDWIVALVDTPAQTAANWDVIPHEIGYAPANDALVVHLAGTETVTGVKRFNTRPVTSDIAAYSSIPTNGGAGASAAWSTLNGTGSDLNVLNVRNGENVLIDVDLVLTVIPPKVARGGMITVAAGKTLTIPAGFECGPWQCFDTTASGSHVVLKGTSVVRPEWWGVVTGTAASQSAALERCRADVKLAHASGGPGPTVVLYRTPLTYRFDAALTTALDPRREVHRSDVVSGAIWDLSNMTGTTLWATVAQTNDGNGHFNGECLSNLWVKGPTSAKTTVDFLKLGDGTLYAANLAFAGLNVQGFRDQIQWYTNAFLNSFRDCQLGFLAARHALYVLPGATNVGENEKFFDCAIAGARIGFESTNISGVKFVFNECSLDYNDITFICDRGNVEVNGGHIEDSPSGVPPSIYRITDGVSTNLSPTFTSAASTFVAGLDDTRTFVATGNNSTAITGISPALVAGDVGQMVTGANIPAGTTIASQAGTTAVLSNPTTGGSFTGATLSFFSITQRNIVHANYPAGTKVLTVVDDHTVTLTANATASGSGLSVVFCADQSVYVRGDHGSKVTYIGTDFYNTFTAGQRAAWHKVTDLGVNNGGGGGGFNASIDVIGCGYNPTVLGIPFGVDNTVYSPSGYTSIAGTRLRWIANHPTQQTFGTLYPLRWVTRSGTVIVLDADIDYTANPKQLVTSGYPWRTRDRLEPYPRVHAKDKLLLTTQRLYLVRISPDEGLFVGPSTAMTFFFETAAAAAAVTNGRMCWYNGGAPNNATTLTQVALSNQFLAAAANTEISIPRTLGASPSIEPWVEQYLGIYVDATTPPEVWGIQAASARTGWGMSASAAGPMGGYIDIGATNPPATIARASINAPDFLPWLVLKPTTT